MLPVLIALSPPQLQANDYTFQKKPKPCTASNLNFTVLSIIVFLELSFPPSFSFISEGREKDVCLHFTTDKTLTYVSVASAPFSLGIFLQQFIPVLKFFLLCCFLHLCLHMSLAFLSLLKLGLSKNEGYFFPPRNQSLLSVGEHSPKELRPNFGVILIHLPSLYVSCIQPFFSIITVTNPKQFLTSSYWEYK